MQKLIIVLFCVLLIGCKKEENLYTSKKIIYSNPKYIAILVGANNGSAATIANKHPFDTEEECLNSEYLKDQEPKAIICMKALFRATIE